MVTIEIRNLSVSEIFQYLSKNNQLFNPPLTSRLDIMNYAIKLNKYAVHFCALENIKLVGFMGCYFNDPHKESGFISSFSVIKASQGKGVAKRLLNSAIEYAIENGFKQIRLHVDISNIPVKNLYTKSGFFETSHNLNMSEMALNLSKA
jgi:ribosomal protein S18 acetylase RimI-like enzyme